jgi:hypothetical protein
MLGCKAFVATEIANTTIKSSLKQILERSPFLPVKLKHCKYVQMIDIWNNQRPGIRFRNDYKRSYDQKTSDHIVNPPIDLVTLGGFLRWTIQLKNQMGLSIIWLWFGFNKLGGALKTIGCISIKLLPVT